MFMGFVTTLVHGNLPDVLDQLYYSIWDVGAWM